MAVFDVDVWRELMTLGLTVCAGEESRRGGLFVENLYERGRLGRTRRADDDSAAAAAAAAVLATAHHFLVKFTLIHRLKHSQVIMGLNLMFFEMIKILAAKSKLLCSWLLKASSCAVGC